MDRFYVVSGRESPYWRVDGVWAVNADPDVPMLTLREFTNWFLPFAEEVEEIPAGL